jgi:hypothetical protein
MAGCQNPSGEAAAMNNSATTLSMHHTPLSRMFRGDPFAHFLWKLGITPLRMGVLVFLYGLIYTIILPGFLGTLADAFRDWPTLVIVLGVSPILLAYYVWEPFSIQALYDGVGQRVKKGKYDEAQISRLTRPMGHFIWFWLALLAGLLEAIYIIIQHGGSAANWQNAHISMIIVLVPLRFVSFYAVTFVLSREIINIIGINRFLTIFPMEIAPLHPDKAGGLYVMGRYVLARGLIVGMAGLLFGMNLLRVQLGLGVLSAEFYIEMVIYTIATPTFFILPLWQAHRLMMKAREKIMLEIAEKYEQQYYLSLSDLHNAQLNSEKVDEIEAIHKLYEIAEKAPTWPLNMGIISQFSAAVLVPVFLPMMMDFITSTFQKLAQFGS